MAAEDCKQAREYAEEYQNEEFPSKYRNLMTMEVGEVQKLALAAIHDIIPGLKKGGRMLDFGCGPTIYNVASASRYFKEIIMGDYSRFNRREVEKWIKGEEGCLDWKPLLNGIAKLEGYSDVDEGITEIEKRIRSSVKKVIPCDILADPPIPEEYGKFDLLLTSYCIEAVCINPEMYKHFIRKLYALVKSDGILIIASILNGGPYRVQKLLYGYRVEGTLIKEAFEDCGLKLNSWNLIECKEKQDYCDYSGVIVASARKE